MFIRRYSSNRLVRILAQIILLGQFFHQRNSIQLSPSIAVRILVSSRPTTTVLFEPDPHTLPQNVDFVLFPPLHLYRLNSKIQPNLQGPLVRSANSLSGCLSPPFPGNTNGIIFSVFHEIELRVAGRLPFSVLGSRCIISGHVTTRER
ncbi:hypothetical protein P154DRAFT_102851 [Amniculicola lignicola CBS 123094]|uniref:Uncharacterized protein n=1 Tax=Amniculicola lignicola CBS 123094 TaxID=1392246 RepID=A0A6A5WSX5_9PLEO|nr:hypothetical protein P154DRAFT_102851 [Amniculicola lignicola CBS 123094]